MVNQPIPSTTLNSLFKDNLVYWIGVNSFLIIAGVFLCLKEQGSLLLYFSDNRGEMVDTFFRYVTKIGEVPVYIVAMLYFSFIRWRYVALIPLTGIIVTGVSFLAKSFFLHPRPSVYYRALGQLDNINLVEDVYLLGGPTSFPSGHTMSGFAIFTLIALLLPHKKIVAILLFSAALLVGISRIYLVQHFLKDVYLGAIMGIGIASCIYLLQTKYDNPSSNAY